MAYSERYLISSWARVLMFGLCVVFSSTLQAQPVAGKPQASKMFSVYLVEAGGAKETKLVYLRNDQAVDLPSQANRRGDALPWPGAGGLRLAVRNPRPAEGAPAYFPVADLAWPAPEVDRALVVVIGGQPGKPPKAFILGDDAKAFPANTARVINLTAVPLMVRLNQYSGELKTGQVTPASPYPDVRGLAAGAMVRYPFGLAVRRAGAEPLVLNSGFQEGVPGTRALFVVLPPAQAGSNKVRVKSLVDSPAVNAPAAAASR